MSSKNFLLEFVYENETKDLEKLSGILGTPLSTVYRKIKRIENYEGFKRRPGSGRPVKFSDHGKIYCQGCSQKPPVIPGSEIKKRFEEKHPKIVSTRTFYRQLSSASRIQNLLPKRCPKYQKQDKKVILTDE